MVSMGKNKNFTLTLKVRMKMVMFAQISWPIDHHLAQATGYAELTVIDEELQEATSNNSYLMTFY